MAGPTMKATELLRCSDTDFDQNIKQLGMKGLLDTISVLQKEMSREQENFNSLSSELSSLKRNSQQYKQIQREMTVSQSKLTSLMNRSMKCFQQQGNQHIHKGQTTPATTDKDSTSASIKRQHSAQVDGQERDRVKSPITSSQVKSTPNISSEVSAMPVVLRPVSNSQEIEKPDDKKVKMTSSINIKPQLSSSQPVIVSGSKNNSLSIDDSVPKSKSSILTVNMNNTAKSSTSQRGTLSQNNTENGKDESGNSKDSNVSSNSMQNGEEKRHSSSIQVIPIVSETGRSSESLDCKSDKSTVTAKTTVQKTNTPTVVYEGNRPYLVDQNLAQNRETMLDQIRNFQRKTDSVPKVVMQQDKEQKKVYESASSFKDNKNGVNEVKSENVDSGAEDGSSEPSPDAEKFVSKFTFPQKPKRDLAKLEEKRKARNSDLPAQEEITLQNESEELQTEKTGKK